MTGPAPGSRAKLTINDLFARMERADQLSALYQSAVDQHRRDARDAQLAADRFKASGQRAGELADELRGELEWLRVQLKDMADDALAKKLQRLTNSTEGAVPVLKAAAPEVGAQATGETGTDRPAAPIYAPP